VGGGLVAIGVAALAPLLANLALGFGPAEYAALIIFALVVGAAFTPGSLFRSIAAVVLGLLLATIGTDIETGTGRLTFDIPELADGFGFVALAVGVFVIADVIRGLLAADADEPAAAGRQMPSFGIGQGALLGVLAAIVPARGLTFAANDKPEHPDP